MNRDRYDLPLTTASDRAAAHYRDGVDRMLSAWHGAEDAFDQAIAEDPGFALAHIARARIHQLNMEGTRRAPWPRGPGELAASATARERSHVEITAAVIEGKPKIAMTAPKPISTNIPAMRWCCRCCSARSASTPSPAAPTTTPQSSRSASATPAIMARTGGSLSYLGWSHTEAGNLGTGRALSERAMALRSENANAAHGLSHAMFEQGDMEAGRKFLAQWLPAHDRQSFLHGHSGGTSR